MKKILIFLFALLTISAFSQVREKTVTFNYLIDNKLYPVTTLTIDSLRLVCVEGTYNGYVIYPDNMVSPELSNNGNGQYVMKYFIHSAFTSTIGSGYKYYVALQRKMSGVWTTQVQYGYFWIGDFGENIDIKLNNSDTTHFVNLWTTQTITGNKIFSGTTTLSNAIITSANNNTFEYIAGTDRMWLGSYTAGTPILKGNPVYSNSAITKGYMETAIQQAIQTILNGNYIESPNIVRLMPNGSTSSGQTFNTWAGMMAYTDSYVRYGKSVTVLICGEGTSATYISPTTFEIKTDTFSYVRDYVNYRGLGSGIQLHMDGNFAPVYSQFSADTLGNIVMEDLEFYFDNDGQTGDINNIVFKNCKFYSNGGQITFNNCLFLGGNYFNSYGNNEFSFTNCNGEMITTLKTITITGTSFLPYVSPTGFTTNYIVADSVRTEKFIVFKDSAGYEKKFTFMKYYYNDSLNLVLRYFNSQWNNTSDFYILNDYIDYSNETTKYDCESGVTAIKNWSVPHNGLWRIDVTFNYEFKMDSIVNWGTNDSINVYLDYEEPATRGHWVKRIYNPYNTVSGESGTGNVSILYYGSDGGNVYANCSQNGLVYGGAPRKCYIYNIDIKFTRIR